MSALVEIQSTEELEDYLAAAWREFYAERHVALASWQPADALRAAALAEAGPHPYGTGLCLDARQRPARWAWSRLVTAPRLIAHPVAGAGALLECLPQRGGGESMFERWQREGRPLTLPSPADQTALRDVPNLPGDAERARMLLGLDTGRGSINPSARQLSTAGRLVNSDRPQSAVEADLTGRWLAAYQALKDVDAAPAALRNRV